MDNREKVEYLLRDCDPHHVCVACDGLSKEQQLDCIFNGRVFTNSDMDIIAEYITYLRLLYNAADRTSCDNTIGKGCCPRPNTREVMDTERTIRNLKRALALASNPNSAWHDARFTQSGESWQNHFLTQAGIIESKIENGLLTEES